MGVQGLTGYVYDKVRPEIEILRRTKVIIDGYGLCNYLFFDSKLSWQYGGQYQQFYDSVDRFFECLKSNEIEPFVVLDGASDASDEKFETNIKRAKENITKASKDTSRVRPSLLRVTFLQALHERCVPFAVCDSGADTEIASLANKWECPVIGDDSDYFIFDLKKGYIPLKKLNLRSKPLEAKVFKIEKLSMRLGIQQQLLPLLASLVGNNFVPNEVHTQLHGALRLSELKPKEIITTIVDFLRSEAESLQAGLEAVLRRVPDANRAALQQALKVAIDAYKDCDSKLPAFFENGQVNSKLKSRSGADIEPWVLEKFRKGLFATACIEALTIGKLVFRPQVENFNETSANQCPSELRQIMYEVLNEEQEQAFVKEWDREGKELQYRTVQPYDHTRFPGGLPSLRSIPHLEIDQRRQQYLLSLESNTEFINSLPAESQMFAASVRYWIQHAQPKIKESHLRALLICSLKQPQYRAQLLAVEFDITAQHSFAQWQCVMREAVNLNFLLQEPLLTPRIRHLYDGLLVQQLASNLGRVETTQMTQFEDLYKAATSGIEDKILP